MFEIFMSTILHMKSSLYITKYIWHGEFCNFFTKYTGTFQVMLLTPTYNLKEIYTHNYVYIISNFVPCCNWIIYFCSDMPGFGWNRVNGKFSSLFTYTYFHSYSNITSFSVIVHYSTIWNCCFGNSTSHWYMLLLQWLGRPLEGITSRVNNVVCTLRQKSGIYQQMWL
jgi:hypothetical protein